MLPFKKYIFFVLSALFYFGCQTKNSGSSGTKTLHFADLNKTDYQITDTTLLIKTKEGYQQIPYILLDSARNKNPDSNRYTIGIESFTQQTPDSLKEIAALAVGKKIGASEITILKDKASYDARLISDLSGNKGKEVTNLVSESWEFNYILK